MDPPQTKPFGPGNRSVTARPATAIAEGDASLDLISSGTAAHRGLPELLAGLLAPGAGGGRLLDRRPPWLDPGPGTRTGDPHLAANGGRPPGDPYLGPLGL